MDIARIVESVDAISSVDEVAQLETLDQAIQEFFARPDAAAHIGVWFRLFERFPEDDAYEMFWSILHGIEALPNYEPELLASIRRRPSQFPVRMVNGLLNAGQRSACGVDLMGLLESVANDESCPPGVRDDAQRFIIHQRSRDR